MTQIEALKSILMKIINRHLELESEVSVLRIALNRKGIVSDEEFTEAESIAKQAEEDLLKFDVASPR